MNFFDKLSKKATETYQLTKEKTSKISEELKLRNKMHDAKGKIEDLYEELGKGIYNEFKTGEKFEAEAKCEEISNLEDEIAKLKIEILSIKDMKKCISCNEEIEIKDEYCSKCGAKQPEVKEKVEIKEEPEDAKEAEIVEVSDENKNE